MLTARATEEPGTPPGETSWQQVIGVALGGALAVMLVVLAFTWPTKTTETQNTPVSVAGDARAVAALEATLETAQPGVFDLRSVPDRAAALAQVSQRETYGAIVLDDPAAPEVLTAPAGSAAATQLLTAVATQFRASGQEVTLTPVVNLKADDPSGAGMNSLAFPLVLGGMLGGVLTALAIRTPIRRLAAVGVFGLVGGLGLTLIMQSWFGFLGGNFWANTAAIGLAVAATASIVGGFASVVGPPGIAIGAVLTLFVGNPLSAAAQPWQWLVEPWGAIGQHMVPGAAMTLLRSLTYFPDAATAGQWWTLLAWLLVGVTLVLLGHRQHRARARVQVSADAAATA